MLTIKGLKEGGSISDIPEFEPLFYARRRNNAEHYLGEVKNRSGLTDNSIGFRLGSVPAL